MNTLNKIFFRLAAICSLALVIIALILGAIFTYELNIAAWNKDAPLAALIFDIGLIALFSLAGAALTE